MRILTILFLLLNLLLLASSIPIAEIAATRQLNIDPNLNRANILATIDQTPLTVSEKRTIVNATRTFLDQIFVHKNVARSIHNADPLIQLENLFVDPPSPNHLFHAAMRDVFQSLNDFGTIYFLPPTIRGVVALLPLSIRIFHTNPPERRYVVTEIPAPDLFANPNFKIGVEVVSFDGIPIDEAVQQLGLSSYGANPAARINTGEGLLTFRRIGSEATIPEKDSVVIQFTTADGAVEQVVAPWLFATNPAQLNLLTRQDLDWPHNRAAATARHKHLHIPKPKFLDLNFTTLRISADDRQQIEIDPAFRPIFSAELIPTKSGTIGRLIFRSFTILATPELIAELSRVMKMMPSNGLVIDIRSASGGRADYAKAVVELFSDIPIQAQPFVARVSEIQQQLTETISEEFPVAERFIGPLQSAVSTGLIAGEEYTGPVGNIFALGLETPFPRSERVYFGPVITLVDGRTLATGDIFAALQVDQGHSMVVGVSDNTGGVGALSFFPYSDYVGLFPNIFVSLAQDVDFATSTIRFYRTGKQSGTMIEAFGVEPEVRYYTTRDDVLSNECDMFDFLGEKLASMSSATTADA